MTDTPEQSQLPIDGNRRILIVDDTESIHQDFRKTLMGSTVQAEVEDLESALFGAAPARAQRVVFEIESAMQGQEGLECVARAVRENRPYAVAFVDMRMPPGWDGLHTIEKLWNCDPDLQVVICTAHSDYSWEEITRRLGMNDRLLILKKPFDPAEVSQLAIALTEKWTLAKRATLKVDQLERLVETRTGELRNLAMCDPLTGLANRTQLMLRLSDAIAAFQAHGEQYAVLFLDFDRFKVINDSFGHQAGDQLLNAIAGRIRQFIAGELAAIAPAASALAARIGGDEFVVLITHLRSLDALQHITEQLLAHLRGGYKLHDTTVYSTSSIGVTTGEFVYASPEEVLRDADTAMYRAKTGGKDCHVCFDRSMHAQNIDRIELECELRKALEQGELRLNYQPIIALESGQIVGFESLLRWTHPRRGNVSPADFIPLAEETGMITAIGGWVLETALEQLTKWQRADPAHASLYMAVNVSKRQLLDPRFIDQVRESIERHQIEPATVCLEVTESIIMDKAEVVAPVLRQLRELGVRLSMDDFGVGHSSLSCLHQFPINVLKIDRAFISNLEGSRAYTAVVQAIITLAANLSMSVTAEGIETPEQLAQMLALDCTCAQGWLFAPAMPADQCEALLRTGIIPVRKAA